jgi:hypothetical protein
VFGDAVTSDGNRASNRGDAGDLSGDAKGKCASGSNREAENTDVPERGGS